MDWTSGGLWMIGVGAPMLFLAVALRSPRPKRGVSLQGPLTTNTERLRFAGQWTGAGFVAVGSVLNLLANLPAAWFAVVTLLAAAVSIYALLVWKVHAFWGPRLEDARSGARSDPEGNFPMTRPQLACAERCARWRWCLRHPLNDSGDPWPIDCYDLFPVPEEPSMRKRVLRRHGSQAVR